MPETQLSIIRSMNVMIVHDRLDTTSGAATRSTSRPPLGRDHQEAAVPMFSVAERHVVRRSHRDALPGDGRDASMRLYSTLLAKPDRIRTSASCGEGSPERRRRWPPSDRLVQRRRPAFGLNHVEAHLRVVVFRGRRAAVGPRSTSRLQLLRKPARRFPDAAWPSRSSRAMSSFRL